MRRITLIALFLYSVNGWAQALNLSTEAQAMLNSIKLTNTVIIQCKYSPECMLKEYSQLSSAHDNDFVKNVINLNIENLNDNSNTFAEFTDACINNLWFNSMNQAEIECLIKVNSDIENNSGIARMRADKLSCMKEKMQPLVANNNLFATRKMANLYGQYGMLDDRDDMQIKMQDNQSLDSEQKYNQCQNIYDNLKPKFR
jgi:hypothetical protein